MGVSIWEGSKAQALIDAIENNQKIDKQQGAANAGKALVVGSDGIVGFGNAGMSNKAKIALLTCFRHVAFLDNNSDYYGALESALLSDEDVDPFVVHHWNNSTNTDKMTYYSGYIAYSDYHDHKTLSLNENNNELRTILLSTGDPDMAILNSNLESSSPYYPIPIPDDAATMTITCAQPNVEFAVQSRKYMGEDHSYSYVGDSGWKTGSYSAPIAVHNTNGRGNVIMVYTRLSDGGVQSTTPTIDILFE